MLTVCTVSDGVHILWQCQRPTIQQTVCCCTHVPTEELVKKKRKPQNPNPDPVTSSRGEKQSKTVMTCVAQQRSFSYNFGLSFRYSAMSGQMYVASKK